MICPNLEIEKFADKGEKTSWTYLFISQEIAHQLKPNYRKSFRVCGRIDDFSFGGMALVPMGEGNYILPLKKSILKAIKKQKGERVLLQIEEDVNYQLVIPDELRICLSDSAKAESEFFNRRESEQRYFVNWINTAKTDATKAKRIAQLIQAMELKFDFGQMIRYNRQKK
ncbi:hypothetical protein BCY91_04460 [Pelobium manganitolerans]|uniref:DUF1905 domain-containing protein n=1 Tax=Pelobium manganitolerans TaxID=1842495 RepID=A0A419S5L3_9SPHI|nr:YdeI/OmpD-associated family protein [Pelobium manganitolerans]RKD16140.1 hypothetical protein BCY91_04460 [Pelobium manganitolerans]